MEPPELTTLPDFTPAAVSDFRRFMASDPLQIYGLDVETTGIEEDGPFSPNLHMRLIQFGTEAHGWCLDPNSAWRWEIMGALLGPRRFVSHTNFDALQVWRAFDIDLGDAGIDTFILASMLEPGPRNAHDLKSLCDRHLDTELSQAEERLHARFKELAPVGQRRGIKAPKTWGFTNIALDDPVYQLYGGLDAVYVRRLLPELGALAAQHGSKFVKLCQREQKIQRLMTRIQMRGHRLDRDYTQALLDDIGGVYKNSYDAVLNCTGCKPGSPFLAEWLEQEGADFIERTPGGRGKLDKDSLPALVERHRDHLTGPVFTDLLTMSLNKNLKTNFTTALVCCDAAGFTHSNIKSLAAVTGRQSMTKPAMQTFKKTDKRLRNCWIAKDGFVFVRADYDSQEIRLALAFSGDKTLRYIIDNGIKQHVVTATRVYGEDYTEEHYKYAKIMNFMQQYGGGPRKLGDQMGMPRGPNDSANPEAVKLWKAWRKTYAGLVSWTEKMSHRKVVVNPWGRRIPQDRARPYANGNYMIQSSGRDVLGDAAVRLDAAGWGDFIWLLVHDEIILEVPEEMAQQACAALEELMRADVLGVELTVTAEVIGTRWGGQETA